PANGVVASGRVHSEAGFVTMLSLVGRHRGGQPGTTREDHRRSGAIAKTSSDSLGHHCADCKSVGVFLPRVESWTSHQRQRPFLVEPLSASTVELSRIVRTRG